MNEKTGLRETTAAIIIFSLSPLVLYLTAGVCSSLNAGALINFLINSACVFILVRISVRYFENFNSDIIKATSLVFGNKISKIVGIVYAVLIFLYTAFNSELYAESISKLGFFSQSWYFISVLPIVAAVICAYSGIEGNTRTLYSIFFIVLIILFFCVLSTYKSWDCENMFPIFGTSGKTTFFTFDSLAAYPGLTAVFLAGRNLGNNAKAASCLKKSFSGVFLAGLVMIVIYLLSVPYPVNSNYTFSSEGYFSSTLSGEVFHRFEIFLVSLNIFLYISATSFGMLLCSSVISRLAGNCDFRPFVLILGVMVFYSGFIKIKYEIYITFCVLMTLIAFLIPFATFCVSKFKRKGSEPHGE